MRKPVYAICGQQRRSSACTSTQSDQHLCCLLPRQYNTSFFCVRNFKPLASVCGCAGRFESYLVANPKDRFSRDLPHNILCDCDPFIKIYIDLQKFMETSGYIYCWSSQMQWWFRHFWKTGIPFHNFSLVKTFQKYNPPDFKFYLGKLTTGNKIFPPYGVNFAFLCCLLQWKKTQNTLHHMGNFFISNLPR